MRFRFRICDYTVEMAVGALFFLALVVLAYFTIILSTENWFTTEYRYTVCFERVEGLMKGDHVMARGVRVGTVKDISLDEEGVLVELSLTENITFREGYSVFIRPGTILGGQFVAIDPGPLDAPPLPDDKLFYGQDSADVMVEAGEIARELRAEITNIRQILEEEEAIEKVVATIANIEAVTADIRAGRGILGRLVTDEELYHEFSQAIDILREAGGHVASTAEQADMALRDLRQGKGTLGRLATDESLYNDLQTITERLRRGEGTVGRLLTEEETHDNIRAAIANIRGLTDQMDTETSSIAMLINDDGELYGELSRSLRSFADVGESLAQGEGTIGKLIMDDEAYQEVMEIVQEVRSALQDVREQTAVSTFGSFIFGAF